MGLDHDTDQLSSAIKELAKQLQEAKQANHEELQRLAKYKQEGAWLEFTLVTGGLIKGKLLWIGDQSLGVRDESDRVFILYKHAIAFIQEWAD